MLAIKLKEAAKAAWALMCSSRGVLALAAVNVLFLVMILMAAALPISRNLAAERKDAAGQTVPNIKPRREPPVLSAAMQHPLFHKSRQARIVVKEQAAAPKVEVVTAQQALRVTGIMTSNGERVAYITQLKSGDVLRVRVGDTIGAWTLDEIRNNAVMVNGNGQNTILEMAP